MNDRQWGQDAIAKFDQGFELIEVYDDGYDHKNEVAVVRLSDRQKIVTKAMLLRPRYHQRVKSLMEVVVAHIDEQLGGPDRVIMPIHARLFRESDFYTSVFGPERPDRPRIAHLIWKHAPGTDGEKWWQQVGSALLYAQSRQHPDAERIALIDLLVLNQDRALKNWVTDNGKRFYGIDNGMAWYNCQPFFFNPEIWGCGVNCLIQEQGWRPIAGVFSTIWAGRAIRAPLLNALLKFDEERFLNAVDEAARCLGFPEPISGDFRFEGILRRIRWFAERGRLPTKDEYYSWRPMPGYGDGSPLMNAAAMLGDGAKAIWRPDWTYGGEIAAETVGDYDRERQGKRTNWPY